MTENLKLPIEISRRLRQEAKRRGTTTELLASQVLDAHLPPPAVDEKLLETLKMLEEWEAEDEALTEEELQENAEVLRRIDLNRCSPRKLFENMLKKKV